MRGPPMIDISILSSLRWAVLASSPVYTKALHQTDRLLKMESSEHFGKADGPELS